MITKKEKISRTAGRLRVELRRCDFLATRGCDEEIPHLFKRLDGAALAPPMCVEVRRFFLRSHRFRRLVRTSDEIEHVIDDVLDERHFKVNARRALFHFKHLPRESREEPPTIVRCILVKPTA